MIVEFRDGKIWQDTRYYAEPFQAPAWPTQGWNSSSGRGVTVRLPSPSRGGLPTRQVGTEDRLTSGRAGDHRYCA
jgi:hypothetical protein